MPGPPCTPWFRPWYYHNIKFSQLEFRTMTSHLNDVYLPPDKILVIIDLTMIITFFSPTLFMWRNTIRTKRIVSPSHVPYMWYLPKQVVRSNKFSIVTNDKFEFGSVGLKIRNSGIIRYNKEAKKKSPTENPSKNSKKKYKKNLTFFFFFCVFFSNKRWFAFYKRFISK